MGDMTRFPERYVSIPFWISIRVALFPKILFKIVILHDIKRLFPKNPKNYEFSKKKPFEDC